MSETLPAVRGDLTLDQIDRVSQWLALSESGSNDPVALAASAALRLYYAQTLRLPPLAAAELSVIKGRLFVQAKLLRALAAQHGYRVTRVDSSDSSCTAVLERDGKEVGRSTFTIADAKRAGLIRERSAWQSHPARMLWARASKYVLDDYAPEVTLGLGTDDELVEIQAADKSAPADKSEGLASNIIEGEIVEEGPADSQPPATGAQRNLVFSLMRKLGSDPGDRAGRLALTSQIIGRDISSSEELTGDEAAALIHWLEAEIERQREGELVDQIKGEMDAEEIPFGE